MFIHFYNGVSDEINDLNAEIQEIQTQKIDGREKKPVQMAARIE
jgi:hypothetical protein